MADRAKRGGKKSGQKKASEADNLLSNAARAIGSALGTLAAKAKTIRQKKTPPKAGARRSPAGRRRKR